jgi:AcrR family transcriptional regulator
MGRSRRFNIDEAIAIATKLFWEKGYEGISLAELTSAMGINPPSFYVAFESKAALFRIVLDRYRGQYLGFAAKALEESTARAVAERLLLGYTDMLASPGHPPGCLAMNSAWSADSDGIRDELREWRQYRKKTLRKRFQMAIAEGDLPLARARKLWRNTSWWSLGSWLSKVRAVQVVENSGESPRLPCKTGRTR